VTTAWQLAPALGIEVGDLVSFVGAGGKTTAVLTLVRELRSRNLRVLVTTTTHLGSTIPSEVTPFRYGECGEGHLRDVLDEKGAILVAGPRDPDGKLTGLRGSVVEHLSSSLRADVTLVEADGARKRSLKAPDAHEPVIPPGATIVCPVVGLDALGLLTEDVAHRPHLVARFAPDGVVTVEAIAALLTSDLGALKGIPDDASVRPILNKMGDRSSEAANISAMVFAGTARIDRIVAGDIREQRICVFARPGC